MLCTACSDIFAEKCSTSNASTLVRRVLIHHDALSSFQKSVSAGCHFCNLLNAEFAVQQGSGHEDILHSIQWSCDSSRIYFSLVKADGANGNNLTTLRTASFDIMPVDELDKAASYYEYTPTTLSASSLSTACNWLNTCLKEHKHYCAQGTTPGEFFPSRIIDVGAEQNLSVRLTAAEDVKGKTNYATLSHCWGASQILKLEQAKLETFRQGISLNEMPKTFRDAIDVTRRLGLRYIWIDSLCILQDSKEDWRKESTQMGKIYRNAILNIAATAASSGEQGLDFPRDPFLSTHLRVKATWNVLSPDDGKTILQKPGTYYLISTTLWPRSIDAAPLNSRGWVLQERLLSPRILHFSNHQLFWQCGLSSLSELFPRDVPRPLGVGPAGFTDRDLRAYVQVLHLVKETPREKLDPFALEEAYTPWETLVATYSAAKLTKGDDKLVAIQALAETAQEAVGDRNIAGLWESRLVEELMWRVDMGRLGTGASARSRSWRAPTWSWASLDVPVQRAGLSGRYAGRKRFDGTSLVSKFEVVLEGYDGRITGQLKSARLTVCGLLVQSRKALRGEWVMKSHLGLALHVLIRMMDEIMVEVNIWPDEFDGDAKPGAAYEVPSRAVLFPMGTYKHGSGGVESMFVEGLLLLPDHKSKTFARLGYFSLNHQWETLLSGFEKPFDLSDSMAEGVGLTADGALYQFALV